MAIKSDRWIASHCLPKAYEIKLLGKAEPITKTLPELAQFPALIKDIEDMVVGDIRDLPIHGVVVSCIDNPVTGMIAPFVPESVNTMLDNGELVKIPSYGLSSYGYDIRLGRNFKVFSRTCPDSVVDLLAPPEELVTEFNDVDEIFIPPLGFVLGVSVEKISMPRNVTAFCMQKSTLARSGILPIVTPLEAGWEGFVTLEIFNMTHNAVRLPAGIGIMQLQFFEGEHCNVSYKDRGGKYMHQPDTPVAAIL